MQHRIFFLLPFQIIYSILCLQVVRLIHKYILMVGQLMYQGKKIGLVCKLTVYKGILNKARVMDRHKQVELGLIVGSDECCSLQIN